MESTNKTEIQPTGNVSKSSGVNFPKCSSCGTRAYAQANCCGLFYSPFPSCRAGLKNNKDSNLQQACFYNPAFLQPIFHNGLAPQSCCNHGGIDINTSSKAGSRDSVDPECGHARMKATPHMFCPKMKKNPLLDKTGEKNGVSEYEPTNLTQFQNHTEEPQCNYHACNCGESLQWTYTSLVIPVMPYCVLWNQQNQNECGSNYSCAQMGNFNHHNRKNEADLYSKTGNKEKERERNRSSSSFLSLHSSGNDENKIYNIEKQNSSLSINAGSDDNSEEEVSETVVAQTKRSVSSCSSQNHSSVKSNEIVLSNVVDYFTGNRSQRSSSAESDFDLKVGDSSAEPDETDDQVKCLHIYSEENDIHILPKTTSSESLTEKKSEVNKSPDAGSYDCKSKTMTKKLIKNFTVTSRLDSAFQGKPKTSAAGGDVGGDTCVGYKVNIESEETQFENFEDDRKPQSSVKIGSEENKSTSRDKTPVDSKMLRTPKTGIAKLIQEKFVKRENRELASSDKKRRVIPNESRNEKSTANQQHKAGPDKQSPTSNSRLLKREEKFPSPKVRPHNCDRNTRK